MPTLSLPQRTRITSPTSIVQLEYPPHAPLPKPRSTADTTWTRFVLLSDTHARVFPVPDGDVLLHSGDLTRHGTFRDLSRTMEWLYALPHPVKIIIAGNRDFGLDRDWYDANWMKTEPITELLTGPRAVAANIIYLRDEKYKFRARPGGREWSVYGSPLSPNFGARVRAFGYDAPNAEVLLTHGPPYNLFDLTKVDTKAGCPALATHLATLRPRLHVFGHIHEARGAYVHLWAKDGRNFAQPEDMDGARDEETLPAGEQTVFVNASNWPSGTNATRTANRWIWADRGFNPSWLTCWIECS
ncbi:Metallo-dependent phosphatase-like protein [Mycena haematopus]|nr:Metallo-dependent phosphatase-like protein [Mycena haematopus]